MKPTKINPYVFYNVETGSGDHLAHYPISVWGDFLGDKVTGA
jgi:hypothetical protein